jgi:hypothetical protein
MIGVLAVAGAAAGPVWAAWSHTATRGLVYTKTAIIPDQTEGFISSDGRFVVITGLIGLVAGLAAWLRRDVRGPVVAGALALGGVLGALLTDLVGGLAGGGRDTGAVGSVLTRLPLSVHAQACLLVEAIAALIVYSIGALSAKPDDLGRPDPPVPALVGPAVDLQYAGGDGHAAGAGHEDGLAPQQP